LSKFDSDWSWLVGDKVLQCTSRDIAIKDLGHNIGIALFLLGKLYGNWGGFVSNKIFESTSSNIGIEKGTKIVVVSLLGSDLEEGLSDWA